MKCVPMSPFVLAPQMKNVPASNQNENDFEARRSAPNATAIALPLAGALTSVSVVAPYGSNPTCSGRSRTSSTTGTIATSAALPMVQVAWRQPKLSAIVASNGRKTS